MAHPGGEAYLNRAFEHSGRFSWANLSKLVETGACKSIFSVFLFLILGHTFGSHYLELWGRRQLVGGLLISALSSSDGYATIDWDELVYFPRALAVAQGHSPLDPWVDHEIPKMGWGPFPPFAPLVFGTLTRLVGDLHIALYLAVVASTVLQGWILTLFFQGPPLQLGFWGAFVASVWFIKFPWFAVRFFEFPSFTLANDYSLKAFIEGSPRDAFLDVEAGLFTYFPYLAFLLLFWLLVNESKHAVLTGILAGSLTYVYFYHQVFAFLLISAAAVMSFLEDGWNKCKPYLVALIFGLLFAIPHYVQLWQLSRNVDLFEYIQRLGYEDGRFSIQNLVYLWYLPGLLLVGAVYGIVRRPGPHKLLCLRVLGMIVVSYVIVLNLRVVLGFDMNSDHYWRQSLGLPATLWMIVATGDLLKDLVNRNTLLKSGMQVAMGVLGIAVVAIAIKKHWGTWDPGYYENNALYLREYVSDTQKDMVGRMQLLKTVLHSGEVLLVSDPATAYHAVTNLQARLFVPSGMSVLSNREILERYFVAQYFSGSPDIRGPRDLGKPRIPGKFIHAAGEHLFLFVNYSAKEQGDYTLGDELVEMIRGASIEEAEKIYKRRIWRVDIILGHQSERGVALERIRKYFRVLEMHDENGYWILRVERKADTTG